MYGSILAPSGVRVVSRIAVLLAMMTLAACVGFGTKSAEAQTVTLNPDPLTVDFGEVTLDTTSDPLTVTITNTTAGPLEITGASISGPDAADFELLDFPSGGVTLNENGSATFQVSFTASVAGERVANLDYTTNTVPIGSTNLTGTGVAPTATNAAPTITKVRPAPRSKVEDRTPRIAATVRDAETNLAKRNIKLFVDGKRKTDFRYNKSTDRLKYTTGRLAYGTHKVKMVATDAQGEKTIKTYRFRVVR